MVMRVHTFLIVHIPIRIPISWCDCWIQTLFRERVKSQSLGNRTLNSEIHAGMTFDVDYQK